MKKFFWAIVTLVGFLANYTTVATTMDHVVNGRFGDDRNLTRKQAKKVGYFFGKTGTNKGDREKVGEACAPGYLYAVILFPSLPRNSGGIIVPSEDLNCVNEKPVQHRMCHNMVLEYHKIVESVGTKEAPVNVNVVPVNSAKTYTNTYITDVQVPPEVIASMIGAPAVKMDYVDPAKERWMRLVEAGVYLAGFGFIGYGLADSEGISTNSNTNNVYNNNSASNSGLGGIKGVKGVVSNLGAGFWYCNKI